VQHYATTLATVCNCGSSSLKYGQNTTHTHSSIVSTTSLYYMCWCLCGYWSTGSNPVESTLTGDGLFGWLD